MPVLSSLRSRFVLVTATLALTFGGLALAKKAPLPAPVAAPAAVAPVLPGFPVPPDVAARAYLLLDVSAGNQVLAAKDMDTPMEPASLTKLMTAYVVFDALKQHRITLDQTFGVSEKAWKMPGSRMFITPKMQVRVEDLIRGMIVQSGNDATMALAEGLAGSEQGFVQKMNDTARTLGMTHTGYRNPEGLTEPGHITTARDMALLATRLMADFPEYIKYYAIKQWHYPGTPESNQNNRNLLLFRDPTVDGLKTGHTDAAGYNLVATARRAFPNLPQGRRLLAVVFGTASENARANETQKLLNWGYTAYDGVQLFGADQPVAQARVWKGGAQRGGAGPSSAHHCGRPRRQGARTHHPGRAHRSPHRSHRPRPAGRHPARAARRADPLHPAAPGPAGRSAGRLLPSALGQPAAALPWFRQEIHLTTGASVPAMAAFGSPFFRAHATASCPQDLLHSGHGLRFAGGHAILSGSADCVRGVAFGSSQ